MHQTLAYSKGFLLIQQLCPFYQNKVMKIEICQPQPRGCPSQC